MIEIKGVTKYFKEKKQTITAVQDIHVTIAQGEIVGLLGKMERGKQLFYVCCRLYLNHRKVICSFTE